jgi:hypothetical protein
MSFIQAQRERLRIILSALDREEAAEASRQSQPQTQIHPQPQSLEEAISDTIIGAPPSSSSGKARSLSEQSGASGLSKSRSEGDFEKLELESDGAGGGEEEVEGQGEGGVRRRGGKESAGIGGWMPWGWGGGSSSGAAGGGEVGRSSGVEK